MWYVLILSDRVFPSHPPSSRSGEKCTELRSHSLCFFMLPRKLHRKWLGFAIFRIAWGADSHRVSLQSHFTQKSQWQLQKKEAIPQPSPRVLRENDESLPSDRLGN